MSAKYDYKDQLTSFASGTNGASILFTNGYYADGSRMWKENGSGRSYYLYDGSTIPLLEFNAAGVITAFNTEGVQGLMSRTNITQTAPSANSAPPLGTTASTRLGEQPYMPTPTPKQSARATSTAPPEPPFDTSNTAPVTTTAGSTYATTYYTFDLRGNTVNRVDQNANVVTSAQYNAYGARGSSNYDDDPYDGFGGQYGYRKDAGGAWMYLCGARYYSPDEGRFVNRDPIGYAGGINLYSYVGNNPMNRTDPSGSNWQAFVVGGLVTGAFVVGFAAAAPLTVPALLLAAGSGIVWGYLAGRITGDTPQNSLTDAVGGSAAGLEGGQLLAGAYAAWRGGGGGSPSGGGGSPSGEEASSCPAPTQPPQPPSVPAPFVSKFPTGLGDYDRLKLKLGSEELTARAMAGEGRIIAGSGSNVPLRVALRLANMYGGEPSDWQKMDTGVLQFRNTPYSIHYYRNPTLNLNVEPKTIFGR